MAKSDYLEGEIIKHIFRSGSFTKPTVLAVALLTAAPSDSGGGTEVSGGGYVRVTANPADGTWAAPTGGNGQTSNSSTITFPSPTDDWGSATHFAVYDAATGGNLLYRGALAQAKTINNGDSAPSFAAGTLVIAES